MIVNTDIYNQLNKQIKQLKSVADSLSETGKEIPAVARNLVRIRASVKMLELNIVDALEITENDMKA